MNDLISRVEILKLVAHPSRIAILDMLSAGVKCVSDFQELLKLSQSNISQHLAALRHAGIIDYYIDGRLRCYFLKNPVVPDLLEIIKKDYNGELSGPEYCPVTRKGTFSGNREK